MKANFERGKDIKESMTIGQRAAPQKVVGLLLYGMAIMPSGSRPSVQLNIVQEHHIHRFLQHISKDMGLESLDKMLTRQMNKTYVVGDDVKQRIFATGKFRLCNPTIWRETQAENLYRIPRTFRHFKEGTYLEHAGRLYRMPHDIDRYVRFASEDFSWTSVE
jgi:hypothetical protein